MREAAILTAVGELRVAVAVLGVIHDHARGLHQRIANGWADEGETGLFQAFAHGHGLRGDGRYFAAILEMIDHRAVIHKRPEEGHRILQRQPRLGITPGGIELDAVADDPRIEHQFIDFRVAHLRHTLYVEAEQHLAISLTFTQHGDPRQPGLEPFEQKQLEQTLRIA